MEPQAVAQQDASRIKLSGAIAEAANWPASAKDFDCYGFFRSDGELLCCPVTSRTSKDKHPFERLIQLSGAWESEEVVALEDLPGAETLTLPYRFRTFAASWPGKSTAQIDLKLGSAYLGFLGWIGSARPPIYPVVRGELICLYSHEKLQALRREQIEL